MNKDEIANAVFGGPMEIGYIVESTKEWVPQFVVPKNLVMYAAADILAKVISGDQDYVVNTMYFEFTNGAAPSITPTKDNGQPYYAGLNGGSSDIIRAPIDLTPAIATSDVSKYTGNVVRFFSTTSGTAGLFGTTFNQSSGSKVYGGALVATPTGSFSGDVVFARFYFPAALTKLDGMQIGIKWGVQFSA